VQVIGGSLGLSHCQVRCAFLPHGILLTKIPTPALASPAPAEGMDESKSRCERLGEGGRTCASKTLCVLEDGSPEYEALPISGNVGQGNQLLLHLQHCCLYSQYLFEDSSAVHFRGESEGARQRIHDVLSDTQRQNKANYWSKTTLGGHFLCFPNT